MKKIFLLSLLFSGFASQAMEADKSPAPEAYTNSLHLDEKKLAKLIASIEKHERKTEKGYSELHEYLKQQNPDFAFVFKSTDLLNGMKRNEKKEQLKNFIAYKEYERKHK